MSVDNSKTIYSPGFQRALSWRAVRLWQRNFDIFIRLWRFEIPSYVLEPLLVLGIMGVGLGTYFGISLGQNYIEFIVPGIVASYAMYAATYESTYGVYSRLEWQRIYEAILATPVSAEEIIAGEILWAGTRAAMAGGAILTVSAVLGLVPSLWAVFLIPLTLIEGILFGAAGMIFTSFVPSFYTFNFYYTLFITPMFYFSGVFFPLSSFPALVQQLAWLAPLTPVVYIGRRLATGRFEMGLIWACLYVVGMVLLLVTFAITRMRKRIVV